MIEQLKEKLIQEGKSQAWFSRQIGAYPYLVSRWLSGKTIPSVKYRKMINDFLNDNTNKTGDSNERRKPIVRRVYGWLTNRK